jgi:hypothetical protein
MEVQFQMDKIHKTMKCFPSPRVKDLIFEMAIWKYSSGQFGSAVSDSPPDNLEVKFRTIRKTSSDKMNIPEGPIWMSTSIIQSRSCPQVWMRTVHNDHDDSHKVQEE